jgi:hypothetical protein
MNSRIESLRLIELSCWQQLERAAAQRDHPWRTMAMATTDGQIADVRSVILREVDAATRTLMFYTDVRSAKVEQLTSHPVGTVLAWSTELGWQLRLRCRFEIDHGGLAASSRWARLKLTPAAQDYLSPLAPGSMISSFDAPRAPRECFALILAQVEAVDWLELHADGHRRAAFDVRGSRWLQP